MGYEQLANYGVLGIIVAVLLHFIIKQLTGELKKLGEQHERMMQMTNDSSHALKEIVEFLKKLNGRK